MSRVYIDSGIFSPAGRMRLDTGTELSDVFERIYAIRPDDPLSAHATMTQESVFERGDWKARIVTRSEMTATKTDFHFIARTECWDDDELFHEVDWDQRVPRNGM